MNKRSLYYIAFGLLLMITACNSNKKNSNMEPLTIENNEIKTPFFAAPDTSINVEELKHHLQKYPERWHVAFDFLAKLDTTNLELGRTELSKDVYVTVAEYEPKKIEESYYESHRNYIDIQYLLSGREYIAVNKNIGWLKITKPYDEEKDYMNYEYDDQKLLLANQESFFIFFPTDAHMPSVRVSKKDKVKKLVIKVRYN